MVIGKTPTFIALGAFKVGRVGSIPTLRPLKEVRMNSFIFKKFKKRMGQANHFLVTTWIGLDAVATGEVQQRDAFNVCWNPHDIIFSVKRSKEFLVNAALSWTVDNLDMYLRMSNHNPKLLSDDESKSFFSTSHSVYEKYKIVIKNHSIDLNKKAFVDVLIAWRNNMMHYEAENKLLSDSEKFFKNDAKSDAVIKKYHLDVELMLNRFYNKKSPSFKEITTLISMTIHFVEDLDQDLMLKLNQERFIKETIKSILKANNDYCNVFSSRNVNFEKKVKKIKSLLKTEKGITEEFYNEIGNKTLMDLARLSPEQAYVSLELNMV